MTNYKITFTGNNLYTRHEMTPTVFSRNAVEAKTATYIDGKLLTPAVEAKEAVAFKAAEYAYTPFRATFDLENSDELESGAELFKAWLEESENTDQLSDLLNISVEKESKSYTVSYTKRFTSEVTAEVAQDNDLEDESAVEDWLSYNGDGDLYDPEDTGEMSDIEVEEEGSGFIEVEWN
jgi:hypothetical protein|tara:strand:+ start:2160 stop:2696 length:537 start_codon:yes stop_codon:yes gene_type:complete